MTEIKVTPDKLHSDETYQASCKGWLIIRYPDVMPDASVILNNVRAYVSRIESFVTHKYKDCIDDIWLQILEADDFIELLKPDIKTRRCKDFNKYSVMRLIGVLREKGVYEQRSDRKFNILLEQTPDSTYRKYLGMGLEYRSQLIKIGQIVDNFKI